MRIDDVAYAAEVAAALDSTNSNIELVEGMIPHKDDVGHTYVYIDVWGEPEADGSPENGERGRAAIDVVDLLAALKATREKLRAELAELGVEFDD